jgi:hypothetical protein
MADQYGDLFDDANDGQQLPPDIQIVFRRLLDDGAAWRTDVPDMPGLDERVHAMSQMARLSDMQLQTQTRRPLRDQSAPAAIDLSIHRTLQRKESSSTMKARLGTMAAVAAMVAVVVLLIGVFALFRGGRTLGHSGNNPVPTVAPIQWQSIPGLGYSSERPDDSGPAVAPSDPRVVYESNVGREGAYGGKAFLRRTDNAGATWHNLAFPVPVAHIQWIDVMVSPLDPHTVILEVADNTTSDCPASFIAMNTEANQGYCALQYLSTDGGATWSLLHTPFSNLNNGVAYDVPAIVAQGSTLYAQVNCADGTCVRLVGSADGGRSWRLIDTQLHQQAPYVCGFAAAPRGQTLFAITADKSCLLDYQGTLKLTLWRGDNSGTTWVAVTKLPTSNVYGLLAVDSGNPTQPLLYGFMPKTVKVTPDKAGFPHGTLSDYASDIYVSADGGKTWVSAPSQGVAAGVSPYRVLGVLSDGTIIASFIPQGFNNDNGDLNGSVLYGWKQGEASWHQVGPQLNKILSTLTIVPGSNGHDTLWIMEESFNGQPWSSPDIYTAVRCQLP